MSWFKSNNYFKRIEAENKKIEAENNRLRIIKEKEDERLRIIKEKEEERLRISRKEVEVKLQKSRHIYREKYPDYSKFIMKDSKKYTIISRPDCDFQLLDHHKQIPNLKSSEFFKVELETIRKVSILCPNLNSNQSLTINIDIKAISIAPNEKSNRFDICWSIIGLSSTESQIAVWLREKRKKKEYEQWIKNKEKKEKEWKKEHPYGNCCNNDYDMEDYVYPDDYYGIKDDDD